MVLACRRCGGLRACGVRHAVWMTLFLWLLVISVRISFLSYSPFDCLLVFSFNSIQLRKQEETMPSKRNRVQGGNAKGQRLLCHREILLRERGRTLRVTQISPLRLA
ncbi:putative retrotransposon hot spot (RHS) protein [Trypanosoma cruzi]|nr:putative retrotransposon hot spot (RHS) protein [Trypanosoma cruzi]